MRINTFLPSLLGPWKVPEENSFLIKVLKEDALPTAFRKKHVVSQRGWSEVSLWLRLQGWKQSSPAAQSSQDWLTPQRQAPARPRGPGQHPAPSGGGSEARWPEKVTKSPWQAWAQCQAPAPPLHAEEAATFP